MPSDKATSADNQQERQDYYLGRVVGFVDGEGCFSVGIFRNRICVRSRNDIREKIIPFFQKYPLRTAKEKDFLRFAKIIHMMDRKVHLTHAGMKRIAKMVEQMNRKKTSRHLESSETIRRTPRACARE